MRILTFTCVLLSVFAFTLGANAQSPAVAELEPEALTYRIRPIPQPDRTLLEIVLSLDAKPEQAFKIKLPTDNFG
ncbi:MAG: hypothetical protein QUS14_10650, partial [Pyrinomonadaceae bacterium]|nr:hypothetical protein [Pyrinomonadaceae bacterium]